MKVIHALIVLAFILTVITGCDKKQESVPAAQPAKIIATAAYEKSFGPAPTADKGAAYAFVIYFSPAKEPSKLVPFPFFTFDEASLKKVAIERLLIGMDIGSYKGEFLNMPSGSRIVSLNEEKGDVTLTLSKEFSKGGKDGSVVFFAGAIATTLSQFKGVSAVHILIEGNKSQLNSKVDESTIMTPGSPRLLSVTAMRDKGAKNIEEINAFFDRPVDVKELKLLSNEGQQFSGELFHSVFDMAAVLKPKDASQFKEGMPIQVRWKVVDKLGRLSEGNSIWPLEVKTHEK